LPGAAIEIAPRTAEIQDLGVFAGVGRTDGARHLLAGPHRARTGWLRLQDEEQWPSDLDPRRRPQPSRLAAGWSARRSSRRD